MPDISYAIISLEIITIIIVLILYIIEYRKDKRLQEDREKPLLEQLRAKNAQVLHEAMEKSQEIISEAEKEALGATTEVSLKTKAVEQQIEAQLVTFRAGVEEKFAKETQIALKDFNTYLKSLQTQSSKSQTQVEENTKQKVDAYIARFEKNLSDFLLQTEQKNVAAIEQELAQARKLIETYKEKQVAVINENILVMLEKTLSLVLSKKLTLKDDMDLIYDSLEKAKLDKFIA